MLTTISPSNYLQYKELTAEMLLTTANGLHNAVKFIIELPTNNRLPFLYTLVILNPRTKIFSTTLYVKPIYSLCITPWDSPGSIFSKRTIVIGD
jgi:hypothetical protein